MYGGAFLSSRLRVSVLTFENKNDYISRAMCLYTINIRRRNVVNNNVWSLLHPNYYNSDKI